MGWPGKAEAGHASRSSGLVQITAARCANGRAKPWAVNLNARLAWRNGDGGRANGDDGGLSDVDATRIMS